MAAYGEQDVKITMEGKELKQIEGFCIWSGFLVKIVHMNKIFNLQRKNSWNSCSKFSKDVKEYKDCLQHKYQPFKTTFKNILEIKADNSCAELWELLGKKREVQRSKTAEAISEKLLSIQMTASNLMTVSWKIIVAGTLLTSTIIR